MRRLVTISAGTLLLVLGIPVSGSGQTPAGDSVSGEALDCVQVLSNGLCELHSLRIDARSGPRGENPAGTVRYGFSFGTPSSSGSGEGTVTCVSVAGNTARIGFSGMEFGYFEVFVAGFVTVTDGGGPGSQLDRFGLALQADPFGPLPGPTNCSAPATAGPWANDEGDLRVVDTPLLPTSKEQCKNGGWRDFGVFKNQGDCVSFVATGGKNAPGN
jgi:hypothetical protein